MTQEEKNSLKEWRKKQKKYHICRDCGNVDAYTLVGRTYCAECAERGATKKREERAKDNGKKNREACKKYKEKNKAEHKCIRCGKKLPENYKYFTCEFCRAKSRMHQEEKRRKKGILPWDMRGKDGICFQCNKRPVIEGKKLCQECYTQKLKICEPQFDKIAEKGREVLRQIWGVSNQKKE